MQIYVRLQNGKMHTVDVNKDDTIAKLKKKLYTMTGIKEEEQRLLFAKKQLKDEQTLGECNIDAECTVMLLLVVAGGE